MIKKIVYGVCIILFLSSEASALEGNIKNIMDIKIHSALNILQNKKESNKLKAKEIFDVFDKVFDYKLMARLSLGRRYWSQINKKQKDEFTKTFINLLKKSFIEKLKLYNNQKIVVKNLIKNNPNIAQLLTELVGKKNSINIIYKFYRSKKRGWIIYDVVVADVSIIQSYRQQFGDLLNNMDFDTFLKKIKKSNIKATNV